MNPETQQQAPTKPQDSPDFLFLPGYLFFCEYVQVPPGLSDVELDEFAEMTMGSLSPFPLEYIHWGWFMEPDQPWLLLYSATKDSISRAGYKEIEDYQHVFPSFLSTLSFRFAEPTLYFSYHPPTQTLTFHMHPGQQSLTSPVDKTKDGDEEESEEEDSVVMPDIKLPAIHSVHVPSHDPEMDDDFIEEEEDEYEQREPDAPNYEDISDVRESLLNQLPSTSEYHVEDHWLVLAATTINKDRSLLLDNNWSDPVSTQPGPNTQLSRTQIWQADVRSVEFKTQERQTRKQERWLTMAITVAVIAALVFVVLEIGAIFGGNWTKKLKDQVAANEPKVATVTEKSILRDTIDGISTNSLQPFRMLQVLNNYRTGGIYFKKVEAADGNKMEVRGEAKRGSEVNAFKSMLLESGEVQSCDVEMTIRGGIATFTLEITFPPYEAASNAPIPPAIPAPITPPTSPSPSTPATPTSPKPTPPTPPAIPPVLKLPSSNPSPASNPVTPQARPPSPPPPPPTKPPSLPPGITPPPVQKSRAPSTPNPSPSSTSSEKAPKTAPSSANTSKPSTPPTTSPRSKPSKLPPGIPATTPGKPEKKSPSSDPLQFPTGKPPSTKAPSGLPPGIPPPPPLPQK